MSIRSKLSTALLMTPLVLVLACTGKTGPAGAAGATGATGAAGQDGAAGQNGSNGTNGQNGTPGAPGVTNLLPWTSVTTATAIQANQGYLANGTAPVVFTLPANPAVGDLVAITGVGSGWRVAQGPGQWLSGTGFTPDQDDWTALGVPNTGGWGGASISGDGSRVLLVDGVQPRLSLDQGQTFTILTAFPINGFWGSCAMSADGKVMLVGATEASLDLYLSTDSGATWAIVPNMPKKSWWSMAASSDGTHLIATVGTGYVSADKGATWKAITGAGVYPIAVACSADGSKMFAADYLGSISRSLDGGVTWNIVPGLPLTGWSAVACSADGTQVIGTPMSGQVYASTDSGATFQVLTNSPFSANNEMIVPLTISGDGSVLIMSAKDYYPYVSMDGGATWTKQQSVPWANWMAFACSNDGRVRLACENLPGVVMAFAGTAATSTVGVNGGLIGAVGTTVEFVYAGNGEFQVLSQNGTIVSR